MSARLEFYRIFKEVADCKSISAAAKKLYITQSAVSQTIKQLETALGTTLFIRNAKGVSLTKNGEYVYSYVASALGLIDTAEHHISMQKSLVTGELRIGASDTITNCYLVKYLEDFHEKYSGVKLKIYNGTTGEVISLLKRGMVDIAFGNMPVADAAVNSRSCFAVRDVFVVSGNFLQNKDTVYSLADIAKMPVIMLEKKSNSRMYVEKFFLSNGIQLTPQIELGSHDVVVNLTKIGLGVGCVTKEFCEKELEKGDLVLLKTNKPIPQRAIGAFTLRNTENSPACEEFLKMTGNEG